MSALRSASCQTKVRSNWSPAASASRSRRCTVRRAETTVELGSGQSFAIAGLLQDTCTRATSGLPVLGEIPMLGALFRSDRYQRNETELVILVTPVVVRPVNDPAQLHVPPDEN